MTPASTVSALTTAVFLVAAGSIAHRLMAGWSALGDEGDTTPRTRPSSTGARVAVVIPARDEAAVLPTLLASLRGLEPGPAEVVVVDDGSRDTTAARARADGATVLELTGPPPGWTGKAWACHRGAEATDADLLLFLDADTVLAPRALADLLARHDRVGGLVSVQPAHEVRRPYEQLSAYFNLTSTLAASPASGGSRRRGMAFGPCLLTSRDDYRHAGGHTIARADILDDVALAGAYRRAGLAVHCYLGGERLRMRMYPGGIRQLAEGWTKNIASGATAAAPGPLAGVVCWMAAQHAVAVGLLLTALSLVDGASAGHRIGPGLLWVAAYLANVVQLRALLRRLGVFSWWTSALFPIPLLGFDLLFARSVILTAVRGSVQWRGRRVTVGSRSVVEDL